MELEEGLPGLVNECRRSYCSDWYYRVKEFSNNFSGAFAIWTVDRSAILSGGQYQVLVHTLMQEHDPHPDLVLKDMQESHPTVLSYWKKCRALMRSMKTKDGDCSCCPQEQDKCQLGSFLQFHLRSVQQNRADWLGLVRLHWHLF